MMIMMMIILIYNITHYTFNITNDIKRDVWACVVCEEEKNPIQNIVKKTRTLVDRHDWLLFSAARARRLMLYDTG
jgi:hypothetical protein